MRLGHSQASEDQVSMNTSTSVCAPKISLNTPPSGGLGEVESGAAAGRKRRWGFSTATTAKKKLSISITTDSLKSLMPGMKPTAGPGSQDAVVELHPEESCLSGEEDGPEPGQAGDPPIRRTVTQVVPAEKQENGQKEREEEEEERGGLLMEEQHDGSPEVAMETDAPPTPEVDSKKRAHPDPEPPTSERTLTQSPPPQSAP
ncbi:hypothetical protein AGOR_G00187160 [Albula goreensis]|uniref:Uncharacterized protein n=1 Tax=Albula goreensis TaxID=1534307 RepID=A0A8T3CTT5_9TELE|nr:hypothetical protein AGOR_G00187160 [Albula goreensis]